MRICPDCASCCGDEERFCRNDGTATLPADDDPLVGMTVGPYRLVRMLGEGGMGQVYLGVHPSIGSRVAVKLLDGAAAARPDLVDRFFAEAMSVNRIRHENIVNVLDLDNLTFPDGNRRPYIIMEHLEGAPLSSVLAHFVTLPQGTLTQLAREMLAALEAAHRAGVIHRDLKPDNVFVSPQGRTKVLDFGIAKLLPNALSGGGEAARFTQTGMLLGTPSYMSPEQVRGESVTPAADIYAVGVILFEAATGTLPFGGETLYELLDHHVKSTPPSPRSINPRITPALEAVILRALAKDPTHRFASAAEMSNALAAAANGLPAEAWASISLTGDEPALVADPTPRPTPSGHAPRLPEVMPHTPSPAQPRPRGHMVMLAILLLLVVGAGGAVFFVIKGISDTAVSAAEPGTDPSAEPGAEPGEPTDPSAEPADATATAASDDKSGEPTPGPIASGAGPSTPEKPSPGPRPARAAGPAKGTPTPTPTPTTTPVSSDGSRPLTSKGGVTVISTADLAEKETGLKPFSQPAGVSTKAFDGVRFIPTAQALARKLMPDAFLTHFEVDGVAPGGKANLHLGSNEATYRFRSPSRSKRPANMPNGIEVDIPCMVYVDVKRGKVSVYPTTDEKCKDRKRPRPRCSLAAVWKKAYARGAPTGNWIANIDYLWDGWFFDIPGGEGDSDFTESIKDDC